MESNIYQTPEADLNKGNESEGAINFERFSAWGVFGLMVITGSYYGIYWLYNRSEILNAFHPRKMPMGLLVAFVLLAIFSIVFGILTSTSVNSPTIEMLDIAANLGYLIIYLIVLFGFRSRLIQVTGDRVNPFLTFFGSVIYFQYKLNKAIDRVESC